VPLRNNCCNANETMSNVELRITLNNMKVFIVAHERTDAAGNCKKFAGLHVKCPIFLLDFDQILCFMSPQYKILRESIQ
jgi:hypothetical protein